MNWFSAKLVFVARVIDGTDEEPLREESIRILRAENEMQARKRAAQLGALDEHEYLNEQGETVEWRFLNVDEVQDLCEETITDGMEVFSRITHVDDEAGRNPLN